jgi:acylphosphatase
VSLAETQAISAIVSGANIQKVGLRAMIQKLAIAYNLAGWARNNPDGTLALSFQGDKSRIARAFEAIRAGSKKSSSGNTILQSPGDPNPALRTFTIFSWTSASRNITTPYDLVFTLRSCDGEITHKSAKKVWNAIALATLKESDLAKFQKHLDESDD